MRRKELGKYCYMILISNLNVVVLRVECQKLQLKVSLSWHLTHVDLVHICAPSDPD